MLGRTIMNTATWVAVLGWLATATLPGCSDDSDDCDGSESCLEPGGGGCPAGYWLFVDSACGMGPNGLECSSRGDGLCHKQCESDCECGDADCNVCRTEYLCNGSDNCIGTSPQVCLSP